MQKSAPSGLQPAPDKFNFRKIPKLLQWGLLLLVSAVLIFAGEVLHLPAALLLGAMVGGILMAIGGGLPYLLGTAWAASRLLSRSPAGRTR